MTTDATGPAAPVSPASLTYDGPVVWVSPYLQRGGTEHHILYLLQAVRWSTPPVLLAPHGPLEASFQESGARVVPFQDLTGNWWRGIRSFRGALDLVLSEVDRLSPRASVPIVHVHGAAELAWLAAPVARRQGARMLFTAHGYFGPGARWSYRIAARLLRRARIPVIAVSGQERQRWRRCGYPEEAIVVVPNGVPDSTVAAARVPTEPEPGTPHLERRDALLRALGVAVPPDGQLVAVVARLEPQKGIAVLLEAAARLAMTFPRLHVVVMGDGSLRSQLESQARHLGLAGRVVFKGSVPRAASYLPAFDAFCLPSSDEALPLAVLEAMAAGCAVVATRVGGVPEVVRDGVDGLLVEPEDPEALAGALRHLLGSPSALAEMRRAARRRYETSFTSRHMASKTLAVYRQLATCPP